MDLSLDQAYPQSRSEEELDPLTPLSPEKLEYFETIPLELHRSIFLEILDPRALTCFFCVCRSWSSLSLDQDFWKEICEKCWNLIGYVAPKDCSWLWVFRSKQPFIVDEENPFTGIGKKVVQKEHGSITYEGEWLQGELHGKAICSWQTGDIYIGEWVKGERNGQGICKWNAGDTYSGGWKNNKRNVCIQEVP